MARLFSAEWESGAFEGIKTVTETYADYFRDLHGWLSEYFFAKLARACYEKTLKVITIYVLYVLHVLYICTYVCINACTVCIHYVFHETMSQTVGMHVLYVFICIGLSIPYSARVHMLGNKMYAPKTFALRRLSFHVLSGKKKKKNSTPAALQQITV